MKSKCLVVVFVLALLLIVVPASAEYTSAWIENNASAGWDARDEFIASILPNNHIVGGGGYNGVFYNDTWLSTNGGKLWIRVNASSGWSARADHRIITMSNGHLILVSGYNGLFYNDTWVSTDEGYYWLLRNASSGWSARSGAGVAVLPNGHIVITGGATSLSSNVNDTWISSDEGARWILQNASCGWLPRLGHTISAMPDGSLILTGGTNAGTYYNDVWRSPDEGLHWVQVTSSAEWTPRYAHGAVAMPDASVVIMGGVTSAGVDTASVWRSTNNGSNWVEINAAPGYSSRNNFGVTVSSIGNITIMGGYSYSKPGYLNDVWELITEDPSYTSHYPPGNDSTVVNATSNAGASYIPPFTTDPSKSLIDAHTNNQWVATSNATQKFVIDLGSGFIIRRIYYENAHNSGSFTNIGAKNFTVYGSNDNSNFKNLTYTNITGWTLLSVTGANATGWYYLDEHVAANTPDPKYIIIDNAVSYRYYAFQFANDYGNNNMGVRRIELQTEDGFAPAPVVSFTTDVTEGVNPLSVALNDTTTGSPTMWNTSWGDGDWTNDTAFPPTNITHTYTDAGGFYINQYATNAYGTANGTPLLITVYNAATSAFSLFNAAGTAPHTTYLYDTSTNLTPGPVTYSTDMGDGNTSTEAAFYYTWNATGTYIVNHSVSNGLSTSYSEQTVTVGTPTPPVVAPVASFYGGPQTGGVPLKVFFTDVSSNTPTSWFWEFGDGTNSTEQNPDHTYTRSGFRTVNLTATNSAGSNITVRAKFVRVS